ncbi:hypothetical protein ACPA9J_32595 [Pseudomonas aeruginosa]
MIAIAWFGIQTYLASIVLRVLLAAIRPGLAASTTRTPSSACRAWAGRPSSPSGACSC